MILIREAICDGTTGKASAKRIAMLLATGSLSASVIILAVAHLLGRDAAAALGAVSIPLAGLGGYSYVNGKATEARRDAKAGE